ncbi:outer membrane protein [Candidatus Methylopumilus rimovensis]|uniref:outer membrane protein n=1 Tax=Candidatus Methylopumilus rimovensis TaxID=2588535 RepID=UPI00111D711E|nr:porin family protein [Candidatus Methylopumilus rimovensis]QDD12064.1 porin family protein [Candidatus Methylopumilus rimovensis]
MIQDHLYIGAEAYQIDFSKSDITQNNWWPGNDITNKPSVTYGGIMLGYNFGSDNDKYDSNKNSSPGRFNGVNAQFGLGFAAKSSRNDYLEEFGRVDLSDKGVLSNLSLGYSHNLNGRFNIAGNIFYAFGNNDAGQWESEYYRWKIKDIWGVSLEPGYYFNDNGLGYLKLGYANTSSEDIEPSNNADYGNTGGFLYGAGFKQFLTDNIYVGIETFQINFSKSKTVVSQDGSNTTNNKPAVTYGGLMIGYKF